METFYRIMLLSSILTVVTIDWRIAALRKLNQMAEVRMFTLLKSGVVLSALAYGFRLIGMGQPGVPTLAGTLFCLAGGIAITVAASSLFLMQRAGPTLATGISSRPEPGTTVVRNVATVDNGSATLSGKAWQAMVNARNSAAERGNEAVDTPDILIALLQEPSGAATQLLHRLGVADKSLRAALSAEYPCRSIDEDADKVALRSRRAPSSRFDSGADGSSGYLPDPRAAMTLTPAADDAFRYAAQEARRFDSVTIGTDHLLLGLLLKGSSPAAHALLRSGVTVEHLRQAILDGRRPVALQTQA